MLAKFREFIMIPSDDVFRVLGAAVKMLKDFDYAFILYIFRMVRF